MEDEEEFAPPFFWVQPSNDSDRRRRVRHSLSLFLGSCALIVPLLVIFVCIIFFVVPSILSSTSQIFRPHSVKKSWDYFTLVLVLFAIFCGFLGRNNNEDRGRPENQRASDPSENVYKSNPSATDHWYEYSDRAAHRAVDRIRNSGSYPDLRLKPPSLVDDGRWRSHDDSYLADYQTPIWDQLHHGQPPGKLEEQRLQTQKASVDTFRAQREEQVSDSPQPPSSPPSSPQKLLHSSESPPAPRLVTKVAKQKVKVTNQAIGRKEKRDKREKKKNLKVDGFDPPVASSPPRVSEEGEPKSSKYDKKQDGPSKDLSRKRKQRRRSIENVENYLRSLPPPPSSQSVTQNPPLSPPSPPPLVSQSFIPPKRSKPIKVLSVPAPPAAPQPQTLVIRPSETLSRESRDQKQRPLLLARVNDLEDNVSTGSDSPLHPMIPLPPPPPPPPFNVPAWKFKVCGDFVRVKSIGSSSDADESEGSPSHGGGPLALGARADGRDPKSAIFCPSPDVDAKADDFIETFRAGLKLEKMNSINRRLVRTKSNLGRKQ